MKSIVRNLFLTALAVGLVAAPARADEITFNFDDGGTPGVMGTGVAGNNQWTFTLGGLTLRVSAWSLLGPTPGTFSPSTTLIPGAGVCNTVENCRNIESVVDNLGQGDFLLFEFDQNVILDSARVVPRLNWDTDATFLSSSTAGSPLNLSGLNLGTIGNGFGPVFNDDTATPGVARTINLGAIGQTSNAFLLGARIGDPAQDDFFKVTELTVNTVPEPTTLSLLGVSALAGLMVRRRRRTDATI